MTTTTSKLVLQQQTVILCNNGIQIDSEWTIQSDGTYLLDQNQSSKVILFPISGINVGDQIRSFRVLGSCNGTTSAAAVLDADLRRNLKGAGAITDASVGAITQVSNEADTALDAEKTGLNHTVADDYQYYVKVTGTCADNAACDIFLQGIEVDVVKKLGMKPL